MATYAIGDVQGCYQQLMNLLEQIHFDEHADTLYFAGDLVNRGPASLQTLRFIKNLGDKHVVVLGNHDLSLIARAYGTREVHAGDTIQDVLAAPDREELIDWLRHRPLMHHDVNLNFVIAHAGLAPMWTLAEAKHLAEEVQIVLRGTECINLLKNMYGNMPDKWDANLEGMPRLRLIINYFTRMRYCYADGRLDFSYKGPLADKPENLMPWFAVPNRANAKDKIIFGHWAALNGMTTAANVFPLDTGCVWGNALTAICLEDQKRFSVKCS